VCLYLLWSRLLGKCVSCVLWVWSLYVFALLITYSWTVAWPWSVCYVARAVVLVGRTYWAIVGWMYIFYMWYDLCFWLPSHLSHQYNFIRIMLKVFTHIHNVIRLFNLPLVNYLYLGTTLLSHIQKITIHSLCPRTHNSIPRSLYFECPLGEGLSLACKAVCPPLSRPAPDLFTSPLFMTL